jgi:hypothetical protein
LRGHRGKERARRGKEEKVRRSCGGRAEEKKQRGERRHGEKSEKKEEENDKMRRGLRKEKRRMYNTSTVRTFVQCMYIHKSLICADIFIIQYMATKGQKCNFL